jgi:hypothetical protein
MNETTPPAAPRRIQWHYLLLWVVALVALGLNLFLLVTLGAVRTQAKSDIEQAAIVLEATTFEALSFPVRVDDSIAISLTVPFSDTFVVPIQRSIPISLTINFQDEVVVPIRDVVSIRNDVVVGVTIPLINQVVDLPIPIVTDIPVVLDVVVPISQSIPISTSIPLDLLVDVPVSAEFPIRADVPIQLDVPVEVPIEQLGLADILANIASALRDLANALGSN